MSKSFVSTCTALVAASTVCLSLSAVEVGRSRVVSTVGARLDYDSNIFANNTEIDDWIATVSAGTRLIHDASVVTTDVGVRAVGQVFADHSEQNTFDPAIDARIGYAPSDKTDLKLSADYRRNTMANDALNDRTTSNDLIFVANWQYLASEKLGWRLGADYHSSDYRTAGYSDVLDYHLSVDGIYIYSPKLRGILGASYGESWTSNRFGTARNPGGKDTTLTFGFEGELAPKVTGDVRLGLQRREFATAAFGDVSAFLIASRMTWAAAEKTLWSVQVSQGLNLSAADQSVKNLDAALVLTQELIEKVSMEARLGYTRATYSAFGGAGARRDSGGSFRVRLAYAFTETTSADASIGYRNNNSTLAASDYSQTNVGAGFTIRF